MQIRRKIGIFVLIMVIVLAILYGYMPKPVTVDVVKALYGPLRAVIKEEGKTRVVDRFMISAPIAGFARRIVLDVGDKIERGQVLLEIEPLRSRVLDPRSRAEAEARVSAASAALSAAREKKLAAEAQAVYAESELNRIKDLVEDAYVTEGDLDRAEAAAKRSRAELRSAEFAVEVARFEVDASRTTLQYAASRDPSRTVTIKSPVTGQVLKVHRESEGVVNEGQPLIEIGDPAILEVEVDVLSEDAVRITPGMRVLFERWGGDAPLEGRVRTVEPVGFTKISALGVEEQRVLVISDFVSEADKWKRIGDGYRLEANFILWEGENVLQVPASSLFRYEDGWAVFVFERKKAFLRKVRIGHRSTLNVEILSGLDEGDRVIIHPDETIEDGAGIRLR